MNSANNNKKTILFVIVAVIIICITGLIAIKQYKNMLKIINNETNKAEVITEPAPDEIETTPVEETKASEVESKSNNKHSYIIGETESANNIKESSIESDETDKEDDEQVAYIGDTETAEDNKDSNTNETKSEEINNESDETKTNTSVNNYTESDTNVEDSMVGSFTLPGKFTLVDKGSLTNGGTYMQYKSPEGMIFTAKYITNEESYDATLRYNNNYIEQGAHIRLHTLQEKTRYIEIYTDNEEVVTSAKKNNIENQDREIKEVKYTYGVYSSVISLTDGVDVQFTKTSYNYKDTIFFDIYFPYVLDVDREKLADMIYNSYDEPKTVTEEAENIENIE